MFGDDNEVSGITEAEVQMFGVSGQHSANVSITNGSTTYTIESTGLPDHNWQSVNFYTPRAQNHQVKIPQTPTVSQTKSCLPKGKIGLTRTGVSLYNPLTSNNKNAVEGYHAETFDNCDGHADRNGDYHYHKLPQSCLWQNEADYLIGVAMDGYPIYGPNTTGYTNWLTTDDLDDCHGLVVGGSYRYIATTDFPYLLGCFHGDVIDNDIRTEANCGVNSGDEFAEWGGYLCVCDGASSMMSFPVLTLLVIILSIFRLLP